MGNCIIRKLSLSDEAEKSIHREMENLSDLYKTKLDESIKKHKVNLSYIIYVFFISILIIGGYSGTICNS